MKKKAILAALTICVVSLMLLVFLPGCSTEEEGDFITIGVAGPMTVAQGEHHYLGAKLAADEINEAGGITIGDVTYKIKLLKIDTNETLSVDDATNAIEKDIKKVDFLMGGFRTESVMAYTEVIAENKKIFMICGSATNELLEGRVDKDYDKWKYLFRVTPIKSTDLATISFVQLADLVAQIRADFKIAQPKVAILAEQLQWNEVMVQLAQGFITDTLKCIHAGTWRPSATATEVTAELEAIRAAGAHIIFSINSGPIGIPLGRDYGKLKIPAAVTGITVEAQRHDYLEATDNYGEYIGTINTYARISMTDKTIKFYDAFIKESGGQAPIYTAGTYDAVYILKQAIEDAGSIETDKVIKALEDGSFKGTAGTVEFSATHDVVFGPGKVTGIGTQWVGKELKAFWPHAWRPVPDKPDLVISYPGTVPFQLPPWCVEAWTKE